MKGKIPKLYYFRGEWLPVKRIAAILRVHQNTVYNRRIGNRIAEGDELLDPYREPPVTAVMIRIGSERLCISDWARRKGISGETLRSRIRKGVHPTLAVTMPVVPWSTRKHNEYIIRRMVGGFNQARLSPMEPAV